MRARGQLLFGDEFVGGAHESVAIQLPIIPHLHKSRAKSHGRSHTTIEVTFGVVPEELPVNRSLVR